MSINNDTIYSIAQVDVSGGPLLLRVPDTALAYFDPDGRGRAPVLLLFDLQVDRHGRAEIPGGTGRLAPYAVSDPLRSLAGRNGVSQVRQLG